MFGEVQSVAIVTSKYILIEKFQQKMLAKTNLSKVTILFVVIIQYSDCMENPEKKLIEHLLNDYNKDVRPYVSDPPGAPIHVKLGMHLMQLTEVDVKNQVLESHIWMQFEWVDEQLKWEPGDFENVTDIRLLGDQIWMPDLELYNSADDLTQLLVSGVKYAAVVKHNGHVSIIEPKKIRSLCEMDVFFFRFDTQTCELKIGSWTHHGSHIDLNSSEKVDVDKYAKSGEYEILETKMIKSVNQYACCEEAYVDITATLVIRWRNLFYVLDTVIPFIFMSFFMAMSFQLRIDKNLGLRVVLGITTFLVFSTYLWYETGFVPNKPGPVPLVVLYMTFMMMLAMVTVFGTLFVWKLGLVGPSALLLPKCVTCVMASGSYTGKDDRRDNIPLSDYGFMDTANLQETGSVSSLVLVDRDRDKNNERGGAGSMGNQQRRESTPSYISAAFKMDRMLFRVIGSVVLVLNVCIILVTIFK